MMNEPGSAITTCLPICLGQGYNRCNPVLFPSLHIRASAWLENNGFITEAIQHLLVVQEL